MHGQQNKKKIIQTMWAELIEWRFTERPNTVPAQLVNTEVISNVTVFAGTVHHVQGIQPQTDRPVSATNTKGEGKNPLLRHHHSLIQRQHTNTTFASVGNDARRMTTNKTDWRFRMLQAFKANGQRTVDPEKERKQH
jgi:hypothetical protein